MNEQVSEQYLLESLIGFGLFMGFITNKKNRYQLLLVSFVAMHSVFMLVLQALLRKLLGVSSPTAESAGDSRM